MIMVANFDISTPEKMTELGYALCRNCKGGEVFILISDLGGGKTTFVRGMARAIGEEDSISSPSFTLQNTYIGKNMTIEHFDFYRLDNPGIMTYELEEAIRQPNTIVAVEWPGIVLDSIPKDSITLNIKQSDKALRHVSVEVDSVHEYILKAVRL